ncbi:uncharacterized protein LOC106153050 [Lingula anatina]|uniref:Uncharacterized protein LOC106153050 n=1 Tax=Lingula anatina TaxID=7574 RepID=A0A1S3H8F9_LINAN|nr:uncharacterized protein LOC106153050 [Lingula anatina]|eukprot:XP_013382272.1 uncharacterized protein LOC106153050 [Lingula anatina]
MAVVVHELDVPRRNNCCSAEFACPHFTLEHDNPVLFLQPQVRKFHISYVIYRCLAALYFIIIFIYNVSTYEHGAKYLIFISNWSYITLTLHLVILALTSTTSYLKFKREAGYQEHRNVGLHPW